MTLRTSVVIETWNLGRAPDAVLAGVDALLANLGPSLAGTEIVVTHEGLDAARRAQHPEVTWVELPPGSGYYEHKNAGFAGTKGDAVALIDGDCAPDAGWLEALVGPIVCGRARVVAGRTVYQGNRPLETELDFPIFRDRTGGSLVRNFFANNVAFARDAFEGYPAIPTMFHGQCQVLALSLARRGVEIHLAEGARVEHAFETAPREWLRIHLLRGADAALLMPHVVDAHAPRLTRLTLRAAPLPALVAIGARAALATLRPRAPRRGRGGELATVVGVSLVEALGAVGERAVHRHLAPPSR